MSTLSNQNEAILLKQWAAGDQTAGRVLFERYFLMVRRFFRHKAEADAEDLIQQTFLACLEARTRFRGECSFRTFLLSIARNQLMAYYRRRARHPTPNFEIHSIMDLGTTPTGMLARNDERRALVAALQSIPLDLQIAVELSYWERLSASEIAFVIGVPAATVYSKLRRARELLRAALASEPCQATHRQVLDDLEAWSARIRETSPPKAS